jgi:murein tripeptide amidase MpaA
MRKILACLLLTFLVLPALGSTMLIRCYIDRELQENVNWSEFDVAGWMLDEQAVDIVIDEVDRHLLYSAGLTEQEVLYDDVSAALRAVIEGSNDLPSGYLDHAEIVQFITDLADAYPAICELYDFTDEWGLPTEEGRHIYGLKISDNVGTDDTGEADVMLNGCHHAREISTPVVNYLFAEYLCENYGSDDEVTDIVDNREVWIIPVVNPDGYQYVYDVYDMWRKNRRDNGYSYGVDLNRNYTYRWGWDDSGSSPNPSSDTYRGPSAGSEPELQTMMQFYADRDDSGNPVIKAINFHTYSQLVLYPWGYKDGTTPHNYIYAPTAALFASYNGYADMPSHGLYNTNGDATDWQYGSHLDDGYGDQLLSQPLFGYTFEMGTQFIVPYSTAEAQFNENLQPMLDLCKLAGDPEMVCALPGPNLHEMDQDTDGDYLVEWDAPVPEHGVIEFYQLDELTGYQQITDGAEDGFDNWDNENFNRSTSNPHEGSYSFWSGDANNYSAKLTMANPIEIESGDALSYWTRYNIESGYDYAYVEASSDGVTWDQLASYSGNGSSWSEKSHSLSSYAGETISVRFRYKTDTYYHYGGIYFDEIHPVDTFDTCTTLADDITETEYQVTGRTPETYYYRVRAGNEFVWGGWSNIESMEVVTTDAPIADLHYDWTDEGALVSWTPQEPVGGVNLYLESAGDRERLNDNLLGAARTSYLVRSAETGDAVYLEVVTSDGEALEFGPLTIGERPEGVIRTTVEGSFPNPVRSTATVAYSVSAADAGEPLELAVYDLSGRRVATLASGSAVSGRHQVVWQADGVAAGLYLARLTVGETGATTRLVVSR